MSEIKEFNETPEFEAPTPSASLPPASAEWDGWGDNIDKLSHEKARQLGETATSHQTTQLSGEDDGWGVTPPAEK